MQTILGGSKFNNVKVANGISMLREFDAQGALAEKLPAAAVTDQELADELYRIFGLGAIITFALSGLHNAIATRLLAAAEQKTGISEATVSQPHNYTPEMTRLKNISWPGYTPAFGGFCVKEPLTRVLQLAEYPIETTVDLAVLVLPPRPIAADSPASAATLDRVLALKPLLESLEQWAGKVAAIVDDARLRLATH